MVSDADKESVIPGMSDREAVVKLQTLIDLQRPFMRETRILRELLAWHERGECSCSKVNECAASFYAFVRGAFAPHGGTAAANEELERLAVAAGCCLTPKQWAWARAQAAWLNFSLSSVLTFFIIPPDAKLNDDGTVNRVRAPERCEEGKK